MLHSLALIFHTYQLAVKACNNCISTCTSIRLFAEFLKDWAHLVFINKTLAEWNTHLVRQLGVGICCRITEDALVFVADVIRVTITLMIGAISICCRWFCEEKLWPDLGAWWQWDWYSTDPVTITQHALSDLWLMLHYHHISLWTIEAQSCSCMNTHIHTQTLSTWPFETSTFQKTGKNVYDSALKRQSFLLQYNWLVALVTEYTIVIIRFHTEPK